VSLADVCTTYIRRTTAEYIKTSLFGLRLLHFLMYPLSNACRRKAPSTPPATMSMQRSTFSKQHTTSLPITATVSNEISSFRQSRNKLNMFSLFRLCRKNRSTLLLVWTGLKSYSNLQRLEAQLSSRDPRDALYQLKYWPTVVWQAQTDHVIAWGALSATATFYSTTCLVLYKHRCTRHNCGTASMQCRACHQQTFVQPILVMSTRP